MYPLLVACKSISNLRKAAAQEVVDKVRQHSGVLVDQVKQYSESSFNSSLFYFYFPFIFLFGRIIVNYVMFLDRHNLYPRN